MPPIHRRPRGRCPEASRLPFFRLVDRQTVDVYEQRAGEWLVHRRRPIPDSLAAFAARVPATKPRLDLGCGPGWHTAALGSPVIASDAAPAMLDLVVEHAPDAARVV